MKAKNSKPGLERSPFLAQEDGSLVGRELDAMVAERIFRWEWLERVTSGGIPRKALYAPLDSGWIRWNFTASEWRVASPQTERFSDWDRCCSPVDNPERGMLRYSTDIGAAMVVVEKMRDVGFGIRIDDASLPKAWWVELANGKRRETAKSLSLPEAICKAALKAVEGEG